MPGDPLRLNTLEQDERSFNPGRAKEQKEIIGHMIGGAQFIRFRTLYNKQLSALIRLIPEEKL